MKTDKTGFSRWQVKVYQNDRPQKAAESSKAKAPTDVKIAPSHFEVLLEKVKNSPEIDLAKVEEFKKKINSGRFQVEPTEIAEKLVEEAKLKLPK
jgi:flagellar biosynthesis anti-sigma factor FlgM